MSLAFEPSWNPASLLSADVAKDAARLQLLHSLQAIDGARDPDFDRLTALAAHIFDAPLSLLTLIDDRRVWFASTLGTETREAPLEGSFCGQTLQENTLVVVEDAHTDPRFGFNKGLADFPEIRFFAGCPVVVDGQAVGTLGVYDRVPRARPEPAKLAQLEQLTALAASLFLLKHSSRRGTAARQALKREETRRGVAMEAVGMASWVWDIRSHEIECDPLLPQLFGFPPATRILARTLFNAIDRRDLRTGRARFREGMAGSGDFGGEYRIADTHPPRWLAARGRVVERDEAGRPTLIFGVNFDITERKQADERQRLLLREINHRVKNTLATVQALASQTVRHARHPRDFLEAFSGRLQALGLAHNLLSDREWRGIEIGELIGLEVRPYDDKAAPRINAYGAPLLLTPDQSLGLGLILHELASNALKYGALSVPTGRVDLTWQVRGRLPRRELFLQWREIGGPLVSSPEHQGFGSILIRRSLDKVLGSEVRHDFHPEGVYASVTLPLDEETA